MTCSVVDHWLRWENQDVELVTKQERTSRFITPEILVIHYGVANSMASLVGAQRATGFWAHLSIDGYVGEAHGSSYHVFQAMPFNVRGSHAGRSEYQGRQGCNGFSIGIEIANPGPLIRCSDGKLRTDANAKAFARGSKSAPVWPEGEAFEGRHQDGRRRIMPHGEWTHWATYTDQEIDILVTVGHALRKAYPTLRDVVGHDEISPGRKSDPGPAFPMAWLREKLFQKED